MSISIGREIRMRKSSFESVSPIVSIIKPRIEVWALPLTHANVSGKKYVKTATAVTNAGVHFVRSAEVRLRIVRFIDDWSRLYLWKVMILYHFESAYEFLYI